MKNPKTLNNYQLLEEMSKQRMRAFIGVLSVFIAMAAIIYFKLHFLMILLVAIPFGFIAKRFYKTYNEVQRRNLN